MKKLYPTLLILIAFAFAGTLHAQLSKGSPAPDFTVDIISKSSPTAPPIGSFNLGSETGQGKAVCLTFSATWCGPCWNFHNNGVMESIYNQYGPNGTNEVAILFIEADQRTNRNCMFNVPGCNFGTSQGNWMNVPFDMTDLSPNNGGGVAQDYGISYFPTLYIISPDMRAYEIRQRTLAEYESYILHSFKLDATAQSQDATCGADGSVTLTVTGGYGNLNYRWSNGARSKDLTGVGGGSYTVTITDANGYDKAFGPFNISGPGVALDLNTLQKTDLKCNGIPEGAISVNAVGGTPGYQYDWNNGMTGPTITGLSAGTYTVTVTDLNNCTTEEQYVLTEPTPADVSTITFPDNCNKGDGVLEAYGYGGTAPYRYSLGGPFLPDHIFTDLKSGFYTLRMKDYNNCTVTTTVEITGTPGPTAEAGDPEKLGCGIDSLSLSADKSAKGPEIRYSWSTNNGNILRGENSLYPDVNQPGVYHLEVRDVNTGCLGLDSVVIEVDTSVISRPGVDTLIDCYNPEITLDGSASTQGPNMVYEWLTKDGNIVNGANSMQALVDAGGTYALLAKDTITNCFDTAALEVLADLAEPNIEVQTVDTIDCVLTEVVIDATLSSNGPEYVAEWTTSDGNIVSGENSLSPVVNASGSYTLTITNANNGCQAEQSVSVSDNIVLPETDFSYAVDTLSVKFSDATAGDPTDWLWDFGDGNTSSEQNPQHIYTSPGKYTVCLTVTNICGDDSNCSEVQVGFGLILSSYILGNVSCYGGSDGKIDVTVQGGLPPYTYEWNNGSEEEDLFDIPAGMYKLKVTDSLGTEIVLDFEVKQSTQIVEENVDIENATEGIDNGSITLEVKGGISPYEYVWSNGDSSQSIENLAPGTYSCDVTDANGCVRSFGPYEVGVASNSQHFAQLNNFNVYPNPASDLVYIDIELNKPLAIDLHIISLTGGVLYRANYNSEKTSTEIRVSDLSAGVYFVKIMSKNGYAIRKLVIQE